MIGDGIILKTIPAALLVILFLFIYLTNKYKLVYLYA